MTTLDKQTLHVSELSGVPQVFLSRLGLIITVSLVIASAVSFVALTATLWHYTVDDAFITFRYAENIVRGWGITFNQAPPRAEGYTSILWTSIMVLPHLMGIDAVLFSKILGVFLIISTICVMTYGIFMVPEKGLNKNRVLSAAFTSILFLTFPYGPVHTVSGMETALAAFLYTLIAVLFLKAQDGGTSTPFLPLSCLFLGLTRPESNLFSAVLLVLVIFCLQATKRWGFAVRCLTFYILPGILYFFWRSYYYGVLFPLPFYIKSTAADLSGLGPTLSFIKDLVIGFAFPLSLFIFVKKASIKQALIILPIMLLFAYFITVQHIMNYDHRYFYPMVPVLSLLSGLGLSMELQYRESVWTKAALFLCIVLALAFGSLRNLKSTQEHLSYARGMESAHIFLGRTLAAVPWSSDSVIAIGDAGAVPYYSRLETIDTFGLNDPIIAMNYRGDRSDYVLSQNPTVIVFISRYENTFDSTLSHENMLFRSCVKNGYSSHVTFVFNENYYLWVMWRPDSQDAHILDKVLREASQQNHEISRNIANKTLHWTTILFRFISGGRLGNN